MMLLEPPHLRGHLVPPVLRSRSRGGYVTASTGSLDARGTNTQTPTNRAGVRRVAVVAFLKVSRGHRGRLAGGHPAARGRPRECKADDLLYAARRSVGRTWCCGCVQFPQTAAGQPRSSASPRGPRVVVCFDGWTSSAGPAVVSSETVACPLRGS